MKKTAYEGYSSILDTIATDFIEYGTVNAEQLYIIHDVAMWDSHHSTSAVGYTRASLILTVSKLLLSIHELPDDIELYAHGVQLAMIAQDMLAAF